ncbi:MAG: glycosyltransferase [Gammaproteobacteria bacterium]
MMQSSAQYAEKGGSIIQCKNGSIASANQHPFLPPQFVKKYQTSTLRFASKPLALKTVVKEADFAISRAGSGTMNLFAEAGVPQFLLPTHMEQTMNATTFRHRFRPTLCA